jgi:transcriptional regulator with XRE-family HTH domain
MIGFNESIVKTIKKLTQNKKSQLMLYLNISNEEFQKYENFEQEITLKILNKICDFLNISINQFFIEAKINKNMHISVTDILYIKQEFMGHL